MNKTQLLYLAIGMSIGSGMGVMSQGKKKPCKKE
jgi:hypothetical protein